MPVFDFLAWRFAVAAVLLTAARLTAARLTAARVTAARLTAARLTAARLTAAGPNAAGRGAMLGTGTDARAVSGLGARGVRDGVLLGLALGAAYATQAIGLQHTPAAVSGFLTGLFVVFTPVLSWLLLRRRLAPVGWFAVLLAGGGLALITASGLAVSAGEILTLACAVLFGLHIVGVGEWSPGRDPYALTITQLTTVAAVCLLGALATEGISIPSASEWFAIAVTAVLASALAYTVQTWAQTRLSATQTAVILTTEPIFAAIFSVAFGGETLGASAIAGGALVVGAMYVIQLRSQPARTSVPPGHRARWHASQSVADWAGKLAFKSGKRLDDLLSLEGAIAATDGDLLQNARTDESRNGIVRWPERASDESSGRRHRDNWRSRQRTKQQVGGRV
jgi:drug/metabolite transporter (DMT)-like permease